MVIFNIFAYVKSFHHVLCLTPQYMPAMEHLVNVDDNGY